MFTKSHNWQRWSGPRTEVTAALNLAMVELQQWSGIPAKVRIRISYSNQLTETSDDPTALERLHSTDLRRIDDIGIDVELDSQWWLDKTNQYDRRQIDLRYDEKAEQGAALLVKPPPLTSSAVLLRVSKSAKAIYLTVMGPDRTSVEGLTTRLVEVLNRSTSGPTNLATRYGWGLVFPAASLGLLIGTLADERFNLSPPNGRWDWQDFAATITASIVAGTICAAFAWALPSLELLDSTERSRFQRYRTRLITGVGAVIAGLIGTAIWAAIT